VLLAALANTPQAARFVPRELLDDRDFVTATGRGEKPWENPSKMATKSTEVPWLLSCFFHGKAGKVMEMDLLEMVL